MHLPHKPENLSSGSEIMSKSYMVALVYKAYRPTVKLEAEKDKNSGAINLECIVQQQTRRESLPQTKWKINPRVVLIATSTTDIVHTLIHKRTQISNFLQVRTLHPSSSPQHVIIGQHYHSLNY